MHAQNFGPWALRIPRTILVTFGFHRCDCPLDAALLGFFPRSYPPDVS